MSATTSPCRDSHDWDVDLSVPETPIAFDEDVAKALSHSFQGMSDTREDRCYECEEFILPPYADRPVGSFPEAGKPDGYRLRYGTSLDSGTQWRRNLKRRPVVRFLSSAMTMVSFSMAVLVLGSILGIRVMSWEIISEELTETSEDGQRSNVEQVSKEVLNFFQIASSKAKVVAQLYNISYAQASDRAPERYLEFFGKTVWSSLQQTDFVNDVMVSQARNPQYVNPEYPECNMDTALIGLFYKMNANNETSGLSSDTGRYLEAAQGAKAKLVFVNGASNLTNPLGTGPTISEDDCDSSVANYGNIWDSYGLEGNFQSGTLPAELDTGLRKPRWQRKIQVVPYGSGGETLVLKAVLFNIPGPSWAPRSGLGRATLRVADEERAFGEANLQTMLKGVVDESRNDDIILFVLTSLGELVGASNGQPIAKYEGDDGSDTAVVGLIKGDEAAEPISSVAKVLMEEHCEDSADGSLDCNWNAVPQLQYIGEYCVVMKAIEDPQADELGLLLINMVKQSQVTAPVDEINEKLIYLAVPIVVVAMLLFIILSRQVTVPLRSARDNMFLLGDMKIDDAVERYSDTQCCSRSLFTEASDLRLSFLHAAAALKGWRMREIDRRTLLEQERAQRIRNTVEKAVQGAGRLMHPMVLISAESFIQLSQLTSYEDLRNNGSLVFLDTEDDLAKFKTTHSIIFLSHQWLAWGFPDDKEQTHLKAMKSAVKTAAQQMRASGARGAWRNLYVWVDYCSIAQEHRGMQTLAVSSLPVYASSADVFVIVAPPTKHAQTQGIADLHSYNSRGWCRAEMLAKICSTGLENFFVLSTEGGELQRVTEEWLPSLSMYVFEGDFSCCEKGHEGSGCDKAALVEPVLGLYSLVLRQASDSSDSGRRHMEPVLRHIRQSKERFFPKTYAYKISVEEQGQRAFTEERELFGQLVEELESHIEKEMGPQRSGGARLVTHTHSKVFWVF